MYAAIIAISVVGLVFNHLLVAAGAAADPLAPGRGRLDPPTRPRGPRHDPPTARQLHLNAFLMAPGHHDAAWRHPASQPHRVTDVTYFQQLAQTAERGKFDSIFFADGLALWGGRPAATSPAGWSRSRCCRRSPWPPAHIGLIATASTTYNEPFNLARRFASLDHISRRPGRLEHRHLRQRGRGATTSTSTSTSTTPCATSGRRSSWRWPRELWDSWDDDAVVARQGSRASTPTPTQVREIEHAGPFFQVRGPLNVQRSPQGWPLLVQAGSSEDGKEFAARYAEAVFTAQQTLAEAQALLRDLKARAAAYGRDGLPLILPGIVPDHRRHRGRGAGAGGRAHRSCRSSTTGWAQLLEHARTSTCPAPAGRAAAGRHPADRGRGQRQQEPLHAGRRAGPPRAAHRPRSSSRGSAAAAGTASSPARRSRSPTRSRPGSAPGAADGFNIMPPILPTGLADFVDHVVPDPAAPRPVPHRVHRHDPARPLRAAAPRRPVRRTAARLRDPADLSSH